MLDEKILQTAHPILFNTEMVRAILGGRKTVTRRVIKPQPPMTTHIMYTCGQWAWAFWEDGDKHWIKSPYNPGDILYVRETWSPMYPDGKSNDVVGYMYRADEGMSVAEYDKRYPNGKDYQWPGKWKPSIHMPKEAARIILRVTDVKVERLQDITEKGAEAEGAINTFGFIVSPGNEYASRPHTAREHYMQIWDSTIKPADRNKYGWNANPWVFVVEFKKVNTSEIK